mmetsp:Transcript_10582/g.12185  ORF Transcript_10582/g.12185 Transcript_10582/m.12185 type:complete len:548 (-) Transcript_10582:113-1756(-)
METRRMSLPWKLYLLLSAYLLQTSLAVNNVTLLGGDYVLSWYQQNGDTLCIKMEIDASNCNPNCWVGFGLGEPTSGGMAGADIVVAELVSGELNVNDMNADREGTPALDAVQDWTLESHSQNTELEVEVCRAFVTGDGDDRDVIAHTGNNAEALPVVVAFGSGQFGYHGTTNRQTTRIPLLASEAEYAASLSAVDALLSDPSITVVTFNHTSSGLFFRRIDFENGPTPDGQAYEIPSDRVTTYVDNYYDTSLLDPNLEIVAFEPFFSAATEKYVHHFVYKLNESDVYAWAGDKSPFFLPDGVGFPVTDLEFITLQYHYDNPDQIAGLFDDSGVRVYLTNVSQTHKAGMMQIGDGRVALGGFAIPTGLESISFGCSADCIQTQLTVFGTMFHTHADGVGVINSHTNSQGDDVADPLFARSEYYDYNLQGLIPMNFNVNAGDSLVTTCIYEHSQQGLTFGLESSQEMCIMFLMYYPAQTGLEFCDFINDCPGGNNVVDIPSFTSLTSKDVFRTFPERASTPPPSSGAYNKPIQNGMVIFTLLTIFAMSS